MFPGLRACLHDFLFLTSALLARGRFIALPLKHYLVFTGFTILCLCRFQLEFMMPASRPVRYFVLRLDVTKLAETICSPAVHSCQKEYVLFDMLFACYCGA